MKRDIVFTFCHQSFENEQIGNFLFLIASYENVDLIKYICAALNICCIHCHRTSIRVGTAAHNHPDKCISISESESSITFEFKLISVSIRIYMNKI